MKAMEYSKSEDLIGESTLKTILMFGYLRKMSFDGIVEEPKKGTILVCFRDRFGIGQKYEFANPDCLIAWAWGIREATGMVV